MEPTEARISVLIPRLPEAIREVLDNRPPAPKVPSQTQVPTTEGDTQEVDRRKAYPTYPSPAPKRPPPVEFSDLDIGIIFHKVNSSPT